MRSVDELPFIAGRWLLNFVNTAEARDLPEAGEALVTASDLRLWASDDLISHATGEDEGGRSQSDRARQARELLYELFLDLQWSSGVQATARPTRANRPTRHCRVRSRDPARERGRGCRRRWDRSELATVRHVAVASAVGLLEPSLSACEAVSSCALWLVFLDATKHGNRRGAR